MSKAFLPDDFGIDLSETFTVAPDAATRALADEMISYNADDVNPLVCPCCHGTRMGFAADPAETFVIANCAECMHDVVLSNTDERVGV